MQKIIISLVLALVTLNVSAQVGERRNDFSIGGNVGLLMSEMDFDPTIKQSFKNSPTFGFTARYICEKYFKSICGVQIEVNFANMGWKEVIEDGSGNTFSRDLTYVQMPMLMQLGWGREKNGLKFLFEAGPQIGFNIGSTNKYGGGTWDPSNRPNDVTAQYDLAVKNVFDYGIAGGLGMEISTPIGHFILDGRYYYGLGDIFDNSKKGDFNRSAHQAITAKLTYLFDLTKTKKL